MEVKRGEIYMADLTVSGGAVSKAELGQCWLSKTTQGTPIRPR